MDVTTERAATLKWLATAGVADNVYGEVGWLRVTAAEGGGYVVEFRVAKGYRTFTARYATDGTWRGGSTRPSTMDEIIGAAMVHLDNN